MSERPRRHDPEQVHRPETETMSSEKIKTLPFGELKALLERANEVARTSFHESEMELINAQGDAISLLHTEKGWELGGLHLV